MYAVFQSSHTKTRESLGELEKAVETLAWGSCSTAFLVLPNVPLVFLELDRNAVHVFYFLNINYFCKKETNSYYNAYELSANNRRNRLQYQRIESLTLRPPTWRSSQQERAQERLERAYELQVLGILDEDESSRTCLHLQLQHQRTKPL